MTPAEHDVAVLAFMSLQYPTSRHFHDADYELWLMHVNGSLEGAYQYWKTFPHKKIVTRSDFLDFIERCLKRIYL